MTSFSSLCELMKMLLNEPVECARDFVGNGELKMYRRDCLRLGRELSSSFPCFSQYCFQNVDFFKAGLLG